MPGVFDSYKKSLERLKEVMAVEPTPINKDSAIQRFELTYELAWKSTKAYLLREKDVIAPTPRDSFLEAFRARIIKDNPGWIKMGRDRNITSHTYDENIADKVYENIKGYIVLFEELKNAIEK